VDPTLTTHHAKPDWAQCSLEAKDGEVWKGGARSTVPTHTGTWTGAVLQVKTFGVHTSHPRRFGAEHFQRQASTHQPAGIVTSIRGYLAEVSLWASSTKTQENTAASRGAAMPFFSTRGRRKSRLGVYAAK
jgi:hypothetical protein